MEEKLFSKNFVSVSFFSFHSFDLADEYSIVSETEYYELEFKRLKEDHFSIYGYNQLYDSVVDLSLSYIL